MREREPGPVWGGWWLWEPPQGKTRETGGPGDDGERSITRIGARSTPSKLQAVGASPSLLGNECG